MLNFNQNLYANISYLGCASKYMEDIWESVEHIDLLHTFSREEVNVLCRFLHCYAAPRGYVLFEPGHQADHLILVLSGGVSLTDAQVDDACSVDHLLGATLGESALVDQQSWQTRCVTILPTDFAILTRDALNQMLVVYPRLGNKLLLILMRKIATRLHALEVNVPFESARCA